MHSTQTHPTQQGTVHRLHPPVEPDTAEVLRRLQNLLTEHSLTQSDDLRALNTERETLAPVLSGRVTHDDLPPLQGKHFSAMQHGALYELCRETLDPQALYMSMREQGYGAGASALIVELTELPCEPHSPLPVIQMAAGRLIELWRARRLVAELRRVATLVAAQALDPVESAQELREVYIEIKNG